MARVKIDRCFGVVIDVQEFFLASLPPAERREIERLTAGFAWLLSYMGVPTLATLERPVAAKGQLPEVIRRRAPSATVMEKNFFDLTREAEISAHLKSLGRKQALVAGCETDVCVLQSCLGLLEQGYEVYVLEDLLFSSSKRVDGATHRLRAAGATFLTFKTLFHELLQAVEGSGPRVDLIAPYGEFPKELHDFAFP